MSKALAASSLQNIFFPAYKGHTFHRINLEYVVPLQALGRQRVYGLLDAGFRSNLRKLAGAEDALQSLRPQLETQVSLVSMQGLRLLSGREDLRKQLLTTSQGSFSLYRAGVEVDFASQKLSESLLTQGDSAQQRVLLAEHMLKDALRVNERNYRAHFELGWIYLFLFGRLHDAISRLGQAAVYAQPHDPAFALFAQRHLADACYGAGDYGAAIDISLGVVNQSKQDDLESLYECSRYMSATGANREAAQRLSYVVARSPVYYLQAQVEPDFASNAEVSGMLRDMRAVRVKRIQSYVHTHWKQNPMACLPLPDRIDSGDLFKQVVHQHVRVLSHLPYVTLSNRERQIGDLILNASQQRIMREVKQRSRHYERVAEQKRSRWGWVNQVGGALIHTSAVLLLAILMFYLFRIALGALGMGGVLGSDAVISRILGGMLLLGAVGITLFQFVPFGVKKLLRKQLELDNTLNLLRSP
jgi:tetratricopeptide (TPR) repeat protein